MKKFIYTILALSFALTSIAQQSFHRLYDVVQDSTHYLSDGIMTNGGGYATLGRNGVIENQALISHRAIFTTYDGKGDLEIKKDIYLDDSTRVLGTSDLVQLDNGSYIISANIDSTDLSACVVALDGNSAEALWSRRFADEFQLRVSLSVMPDNEVLAGSTNLQEGISIWLSKINGMDGTDIWAKEFTATDEDGGGAPADLFDTHVSVLDSNILMTGQSVIGTSLGYHATKVDKDGTVIWSTHIESAPAGLNFQPLKITEIADSSIYVTGRIAFNDGVNLVNNMWVTKYDNKGEVVWLKALGGNSTFSNGTNIIPFGDNLVVSVLGTEDGLMTESSLMEIDTAGSILNVEVYRDSMTLFDIFEGLHATPDGGVVRFNNHFIQPIDIISDIVKTGPNLETPCSSSGSAIMEDVPFRSQTLIWEVNDFDDSDTLQTDISNVNYYDVPTISPSPDQWCPNEPIIDTLDATPSPLPGGVITYEWMGPGVDGAITPSVVGMEEGEYTVIVTINEDQCYTLCDTVNISRLAEPTAAIGLDESQYCDEGTINLIAQLTGVPEIQDFIWSNGETTDTISTEEAGSFSYSFTDGCGEIGFAEIDVTLPIINLSEVSIDVDYGMDCSDTTATLTAIVLSSDLQNLVTYEWKDADNNVISNDNPLVVTTDGNYTVEVTYCNESAMNSAPVNIPIVGDLQWPKVFFPRGEDEVNRTFGPYNECERAITNYTLKIYNRWGNEVFSSNDVNEEWNGDHGGSESASAVYVWVADYSIGGKQIDTPDKGDVTLLR